MSRINDSIPGRGRGHAARALPITQALRDAGHEWTVYGGGHAIDLLKDGGEQPRNPENLRPTVRLRSAMIGCRGIVTVPTSPGRLHSDPVPG